MFQQKKLKNLKIKSNNLNNQFYYFVIYFVVLNTINFIIENN